MFDYLCLVGSVEYLTLIEHFFEFAVLFVDVVEHLHAHGDGSLADQLYFHC